MAGLTSAGLVTKTRAEIFEDILAKLRSRVDPSWDDNTNNLINIQNNIIAEVASECWSGVQGVYDASYPKSAYDVSLDNVADIVGVTRIEATKSNGTLQFTGAVGTVIPQDTLVTVEDVGSRFLTTSALTLQNTRFSDVVFSISTVSNSTVYTLTINGVVVNYTSDISATASEIISGLKNEIDAEVSGVATSLPTSTTLRVNVVENNSVYTLLVGSRIAVDNISDLVEVEAEITGIVKAPANTLNTLAVPIGGIISVTNLEDINEGRVRETDSELRLRRYESVSVIGASTLNSITANVRNLEGVSTAFIIENDTYTTVDGIPPKAFETVVEGGDEDEIAQIVFDYKPVGIQAFGDITRQAVDLDGNLKPIKFSRPIPVLIRMIIEYTRYPEETFIAAGVTAIANAALEYGNSLNIGEDIIPKRVASSIYDSVGGLDDVTVQVSKSLDGVVWTPYTTSRLPIELKEASEFDIGRIIVVEV